MSFKLLFITSHYFYQPTVDAIDRLDLPCETKVVPYDNYHHIAKVYGQYADQFDACFTSGIIAQQAIELVYPTHAKPLVSFQISPNALHRDILRVMLDTQSMDLSRIAMDFLIPLNCITKIGKDIILVEIQGSCGRSGRGKREYG